ncbi:MAG TPA: transcription antitermination factor NusB [Armatimonadota bacterium]|nr:transcription antitermination factor NusB [Armatimonadota bacterium]
MNRKQRHLGRELALLWLYQIDLSHVSVEEVFTSVPDDLANIDEEGIDFAKQLVRGVRDDEERIDQGIAKYARGWSLPRMAAIDRNILRIALYEILNMPDIPTSVSVDEAVEIAKRYGTDESGKFVNGILGAFIRGELQNPETA